MLLPASAAAALAASKSVWMVGVGRVVGSSSCRWQLPMALRKAAIGTRSAGSPGTASLLVPECCWAGSSAETLSQETVMGVPNHPQRP